MDKRNITSWVLTLLFLLIVFVGIFSFNKNNNQTPEPTQTSTTTPVVNYVSYGKVTLKVGETVHFKDNSITLLRVVDESRCPTGVTCIWAGTVKAEILSVTGMGTSTEKIELGKFLTTEAEKIEVTSVTPYPSKDTSISQNEYSVTLEVTKLQIVGTNTNQGGCYIGGCSSEVCSDSPDVASNCMYKEEYACYKKTSSCKRQSNGKCGWTQTNELKVCIGNTI
jgi:hypothetical protein